MGGGGGAWKWGKREEYMNTYQSLHCDCHVTTRVTPALKMGSDESHFNIS